MNLKERDYNQFNEYLFEQLFIMANCRCRNSYSDITKNCETSTRELVYHNGAVAVCGATRKKKLY